MKSLLALSPGSIRRRDVLSLSAVRMQAIGSLKTFVEHTFDAPVTFTQVDIAVSPIAKLRRDGQKVFCTAVIEAFFYFEGLKVPFGREGTAPIPPKAIAQIRYHADNGNVLCWKLGDIKVDFENIELPIIHGLGFANHFELEGKLNRFDSEFNAYRPFGRPILGDNHDRVVWSINGPGR